MQIEGYIERTEFASRSLIDLIAADYTVLKNSNSELGLAEKLFKVQHNVFLANEFHPAVNHYYARMARAHIEVKELDSKIRNLLSNIDAKSASVAALSGALLQLAKQGLSLIYGRPQNAPTGALCLNIPVKEIIWEGRNQSLHYEHPKGISDNVVELFKRIDLARNDGLQWIPKSQINYAFEIIRFLGWLSYEQYSEHLLSFQGK